VEHHYTAADLARPVLVKTAQLRGFDLTELAGTGKEADAMRRSLRATSPQD
jgi:hypothetical protein